MAGVYSEVDIGTVALDMSSVERVTPPLETEMAHHHHAHARFLLDEPDRHGPARAGSSHCSESGSAAEGSNSGQDLVALETSSALGGGSNAGGGGGGGSTTRLGHKSKTVKRAEKALAKEQGLRLWLRMDARGDVSSVQADRNRIAHQLGIQQRDLRILEPLMSGTYPSGILDRDNAIVVNLEFVKCIITRHCVYIVNPDDAQTPRFVAELKAKLAAMPSHLREATPYQQHTYGHGLPRIPSQPSVASYKDDAPPHEIDIMDLPFELKVFEVCLDIVAFHLDSLSSDLESSAYPALDGLLQKISSSKFLQRVRRVKNAMVRLMTRVHTIRQIIEKLLADDRDMHRLNLSANALEDGIKEEAAKAAHRRSLTLDRDDASSISSVSTTVEEAAVAQVEMLLEAYFMHLDNTYNRLETLGEYIKDTEDLVNTQLDQHRNYLITVDLYLTAIMCSASAMTVVAGFFGTNLNSQVQEYPNAFFLVCVVTSSICVMAVLSFFAWTVRTGIVMF